jgi:hypothetical protein
MTEPSSQLWSRIAQLQGQTLYTSAQRKAFDVTAATDDPVHIRVQSTAQDRKIWRTELEEAHRLWREGVPLMPSRLQEAGMPSRNLSYVAAILTAATAGRPEGERRA